MANDDLTDGELAARFRAWLAGELSELRLGPVRPLSFDYHSPLLSSDHVELSARTTEVEEVHGVVTFCEAPATSGLLTLGDLTVPVPTGLFPMAGLIRKLGPNDVRRLDPVGGTPCRLLLWLWGEEVPGRPQAIGYPRG